MLKIESDSLINHSRSTTQLAFFACLVCAVTSALLIIISDAENQFKFLLPVAVLALLPLFLNNRPSTTSLITGIGLFNVGVSIPYFGVVQSSEAFLILGSMLLLPGILRNRIPFGLKVAFFLLIAGHLLAAITQWSSTSAWGSLRWLFLFILWVAMLGAHEHAARIITVWCSSGVLIALGGFAQMNGWFVSIVGRPYLSDRVDSFFGYYTQYASVLASTVVLSVGLLLGGRRKFVAALGVAGVVICTVSLVISLSRGGALALGIGICVLLLTGPNQSSHVLRYFAFASLTAIAVSILTPVAFRSTLFDRLLNRNSINAGSDSVRAELQEIGFQLMTTNPIGIGYGNFRSNAIASSNLSYFHAHSTPIQIALDAGWFGAAGYAILFVAPILWSVRLRSKMDPLTASLAAVLAGMVGQGFFEYLFFETAWLQFHVATAGLLTGRLIALSRLENSSFR